MAARDVKFELGCYYHIYNRGAHHRSIFHDEKDYRYVLVGLSKYTRRYQIAMIAYCLMPNHYHWLVRQDGEISAGLLAQQIFNGYAKAFNGRYDLTGTLFEGPFKAKLVERDDYLVHLCRYIHANPVKHGFVEAPGLWPYSNYREWVGTRSGTLVDRAFVAERFGNPQAYADYVEEYLRGRAQMPEGFRENVMNCDDIGW